MYRPEKEMGLWIGPSGDPTFGSWRWQSTKEKNVLEVIINEIRKISDLKSYKSLIIDKVGWNTEQIPDGWIWQDIGNYYGAGQNT
jgi:D-alanyl-D-alanine carboxypeptidase/D-alanyl-D-alanine-endopeptidase (penicillin-binding protein 4)